MAFSEDKKPLFVEDRRPKTVLKLWVLVACFAVVGMVLFIYGLATPFFLHSQVIAFRNASCWERHLGLWEECTKDCLDVTSEWKCVAWGRGMLPENVEIGGSLILGALCCASLGLLCLLSFCSRFRQQCLLGVGIFFISAGLVGLVGAIFTVLEKRHLLEAMAARLYRDNLTDVYPGYSFALNVAGSSLFLLTGLVASVGWCKTSKGRHKTLA